MKIAILGPAPPYRGGISLFALMLARTWRDAGHEVCFINFNRQYPKLLFPGKEQIDSSLDESEFLNHRVLTPWLPHTWIRAAFIINKMQPDMLIISWFIPFFAPAYAFILRLLPGVRKIVIAHNVQAHEKWGLLDSLTKLVFRYANDIVVLSKSSMNDLRMCMPLSIYNKGILGFHPIYTCYKSRSNNPEAVGKNLLFFGLIKPYKGLDVLLDAMPMVLNRFPNLRLQVAGEVYGDAEVYLKQINQLGIGKSVDLHFRYISEPEIQDYFQQASLCILPYKSASQSGVIATSYSFNVPVLVTDVGGLSEYVIHGKTGYIVEANNPVKMAEMIIQHLESDTSSMQQTISEHNQDNSWYALTKIIEQGKQPTNLKKLMLISYYFPPCGGAAVQRWLRLLPVLIEKGYQVTVITTKDGDYPHIDKSLDSKIPNGVKVLRCRPLSFAPLWRAFGQKELPYGSLEHSKGDSALKKLLFWIRLNFVIPDARIGWNPGAYKLVMAELRSQVYDAIITTGPPHSSHLIGLKLKKNLGVRWWADFRDPWSEIYYLQLGKPSRMTMMIQKYLEAKVLKYADGCFIVSRGIAEALPQGNKTILYNGFNAQDFSDSHYEPSGKFRIKYVGQITAGQRIDPLKQALVDCADLSMIEFSFIGTRNAPDLGTELRLLPFIPHYEAINEIVNAELLVLMINNYEGFEGMLTTKLFEYIASRTPIVCISKPGGEAEALINTTQSGIVTEDSEKITAYIRSLYSNWLDGIDSHNKGDIDFLEVHQQVEALIAQLK